MSVYKYAVVSQFDNQSLTYALSRIVTTPVTASSRIEEIVMRHWALSAAIGVAILISSSSSASPAQGVASGIYDLDWERSDNVFQAIESAIAGLSPPTRRLARMRLRKSTAIGRIRISIAGSRLGIAYDAKKPIVVWMNEEPIEWKLTEGLVFGVSAKGNGDAISLTFRADDSERTTVYRSVGEQLMAENTINSPLFSTPIRYNLVYNRAN